MLLKYFGDNIEEGKYELHSKFNNVVNLTNINDKLISLSNKIDYLAPNSIIFDFCNIQEIKQITIANKLITINETDIKIEKIKKYNSNYNYLKIPDNQLLDRIDILLNEKKTIFPEKSLIFLLNLYYEKYFISSFEKVFLKIIKEGFNKIIEKQYTEGIKIIKGTGQGLTPAGDDFIAGILFGLHFNEFQYNIDLQLFKDVIYNEAKTDNIFSKTFLEFAYNSLYFNRLKEFLDEFLSEEIKYDDLFNSLDNLFKIGETSGADLLTGFLTAIKYKIGYDN